MTLRPARCLGIVLLSLCLPLALSAAGARFWHVATQAEFLRGEVSNLSIDLHGRLVLGPEATAVASVSSPFLWAIAPGPEGSVYVGTGNDGQVLRVAADGTQSVFFDSAELEVHAIVASGDGGLYVATSPEGRIYKVDAKGAGTPYFDPEDKYIWALATDAKGVLYAATGERGIVYRVTGPGKAEPFYRTKATHARALAFDAQGQLIVGTESPGKVFRIGTDATGFVLLDAGHQEISAIRLGPDGAIYAAAVTGRPAPERSPDRPPAETPGPTPIPTVSTEITSVAIVDAPMAGGPMTSQPRQERRSVRGALYRIMPDGIWDIVWNSQEDAPYDVLPEPDGALLVATGNAGKVYRLDGEPMRATLIARADAQQVTGLARGRQGHLWFTTANSGKVVRVSPEPAARGTYESDVRDAGTVATWGTITWQGSAPSGTSVKLFTRSGNTSVPDETWSPWSGAYTESIGEQVTSPKARYLQWKAELTGRAPATPVVTSVTVAYLQRNLRPDVSSITVYPPGVVFQKPFSSGDTEIAGFDGTTASRRNRDAAQNGQVGMPVGGGAPLGRRSYERGLQTFLWKAEDANDDELQYDIQYRREGETAWKPLKRGLTEPLYVWDTSSVPNGTYLIRVVASDGPANPPGAALSGERESQTFRIDNAPPAIEIGEVRRDGGRTVVEFTVRDEHSPVQRVEYSLDADRWRAIYPKDGIADSVVEHFELSLEGAADGRAVIIRAADAMENVATARPEASSTR